MPGRRTTRLATKLTAGTLLTALVLVVGPVASAFDAEFTATKETLKHMKIEKPTAARNFVDNVAVYLRILPIKGNRVFPVFIDTRNYLTCPDSDKRFILKRVAQVNYDRRRGIKVLGFFFENPGCDMPHFHLDGVVADS